MATKSIFKDVRIKSKNSCQKLLSALERTRSSKPIEVIYSKSVATVEGEKIKEIFKSK